MNFFVCVTTAQLIIILPSVLILALSQVDRCFNTGDKTSKLLVLILRKFSTFRRIAHCVLCILLYSITHDMFCIQVNTVRVQPHE